MTSQKLKTWAAEHIRAIRWSIVVLMLGVGLLGLVLGFSYDSGHYIIADTRWGGFLGYFLVNLAPELAGIVIGIVAIDALNEWRQTEQLKAQLIRQMGSKIRDVAVPAAIELDYHGWLKDGSLDGAILWGAHLEGANLNKAHLKGAFLSHASLQGADLLEAHLEGVNLSGAHLEGATGLTRPQLLDSETVKSAVLPERVA